MKKRSRSKPSRKKMHKKMNKKYSRRNRLFRRNRLSRRKLKGGEGGEGTSYKLKPPFDEHTDKIDWYVLSSNPNAISILAENLDKVDWKELSKNPNAITILAENLDKVEWYSLSRNNFFHFTPTFFLRFLRYVQ